MAQPAATATTTPSQQDDQKQQLLQEDQKQQEQPAAANKGFMGNMKDTAAKVAKDIEKIATDVGATGKEVAEHAVQQIEARLSMQGQLYEAHQSLRRFLNPELEAEKQIPVTLMESISGIVLLSVFKASVGIGASIGSGIVMRKLPDNKWSQPCSIGTLGGVWGINIGAQLTNFVIILRDEAAVKIFSENEQIKFGADASVTAGTLGRDAQVAVNANDKGEYTSTVSYSESNGLYAGVAVEASGIKVREACNEKYYGQKIAVKDILATAGEFGKNMDYDAIVQLLTTYTVVDVAQNEADDDAKGLKANDEATAKDDAKANDDDK